MIQIYILCGYYKKFIACTKYSIQGTDICLQNHVFKVVKVISQRSVKNILSLLTQRERNILLCGIGIGLFGGGGGGGGIKCQRPLCFPKKLIEPNGGFSIFLKEGWKNLYWCASGKIGVVNFWGWIPPLCISAHA